MIGIFIGPWRNPAGISSALKPDIGWTIIKWSITSRIITSWRARISWWRISSGIERIWSEKEILWRNARMVQANICTSTLYRWPSFYLQIIICLWKSIANPRRALGSWSRAANRRVPEYSSSTSWANWRNGRAKRRLRSIRTWRRSRTSYLGDQIARLFQL